jgi:hypothetical protein
LPGTGDGLLRLERSQGELLSSPEALAKIAETPDWRETDVAARAASDAAVADLAVALAGRPAVTEAAAPAPREVPAPAKKRVRRRKRARKSVER